MNWASRRVLSWRLSNTLTTDFCIDAVQEAIHRYDRPEIFNTDRGSQFTSLEWQFPAKDPFTQNLGHALYSPDKNRRCPCGVMYCF